MHHTYGVLFAVSTQRSNNNEVQNLLSSRAYPNEELTKLASLSSPVNHWITGHVSQDMEWWLVEVGGW